jgi:hypothetical protein
MAMTSLLERLSAERQRRFVGRHFELQLFLQAIASPQLPFHILHVFGPGGVGKTSILNQFTQICKQLNIAYYYVEARNLEPVPESFLSALRSLTGLNELDSPLQFLAAQQRNVVLIDTYENIAPLDEWLREEFLPQLSDNTLIVLAGRNPPSSSWHSDSGWQALINTLSIRNLNPEESQTYLSKRDIPLAQHRAILDFTHGHPLALSLVADMFAQTQEISFQPESAPDIVKVLLQRFIKEVPTPTHRMALQACAVVRITTEALLTQMLGLPEVHDLFEWLRELSFIESGQLGLFPHDLAREVLIADLRWRNTDFYAQLHHQARNYYSKRLGQIQEKEKHQVLFDYIFLHRDNPAIRPCFTWGEHSSLLRDSLQESDKNTLLAMVRQYEGEESAKIAAHWLGRQPQNVVVLRSQQQIAGFAMMVALHQASSDDLKVDSAALACLCYLEAHAPLRPQEGATIFRFWMASDTYQTVSPTQSLIFINFVQYFQNTPGLAYTFLPCAEADAWAPMLSYFDLMRLPEVDFEVGGRHYGVYGHDWRVVSPTAWRELLAKREVAADAEVEASTSVSQPMLVLSREDFVEGVQNALRNFTRADTLQNNPLMRSRIVYEQLAPDTAGESTSSKIRDRMTTLQTLLKQAAESLQSSPRDDKLYRAVYRTYLNPAPTQEQAAELLDLPFSTYRRHLKAGMIRIADILWQREIS